MKLSSRWKLEPRRVPLIALSHELWSTGGRSIDFRIWRVRNNLFWELTIFIIWSLHWLTCWIINGLVAYLLVFASVIEHIFAPAWHNTYIISKIIVGGWQADGVNSVAKCCWAVKDEKGHIICQDGLDVVGMYQHLLNSVFLVWHRLRLFSEVPFSKSYGQLTRSFAVTSDMIMLPEGMHILRCSRTKF